MGPKPLITPKELADERARWRDAKLRVALVPTMGALHAGHAALVTKAKTLADRVVVSIFVNPTQFGPNEDFARYPRTLAADESLLAGVGADAIFLPNAATIYPDGFQTYVHNKMRAHDLCGTTRPGHFEGVLTVVLKLLMLAAPDVALFGKKDYQQWRLIAQMVEDFCLPVVVEGVDTIREPDGLALSSRNRYLDAEGRASAVCLNQACFAINESFKAGARQVDELSARGRAVLASPPSVNLEYLEIRRQRDLLPFVTGRIDHPAVVLIAARVGGTRLIDNVELS